MGCRPSSPTDAQERWNCRCAGGATDQRWAAEADAAGDREVTVLPGDCRPGKSADGLGLAAGHGSADTRAEIAPATQGENPQGGDPAPLFPLTLGAETSHELSPENRDWSRRPTNVTTWSRMQTGNGSQSDAASSYSAGLEDEEDDDDDGCSSVSSSSSTRNPKRRTAKSLRVIETMGMVPSASLQVVIDNPGVITDFYDVEEKPLGQGSFGVVRKATVKVTGAPRAVKSILKERMKEKRDVLKQEIEIMKMVDHPNIVMLNELFEDGEALYLVMELCSGGHLEGRVKRVGRLTEPQAAGAMRQLLRGVQYLHAHHICHRDLKAENLLLSTAEPLESQRCVLKLSDFGLSVVVLPKQVLTGLAGTRSHMAPEVYARRYDLLCDLWSCGVVLYFLLSGRMPFAGEEEIKAARLGFSGKEWVDISQDAINLITSLLTKNVKRRSTAKQALRDAWLKQRAPPNTDASLSPALLDSLRTFRALNKFKRATLSVVVNMLDSSDTKAAREMFDFLDTNGDGIISVTELSARLKKSFLAAPKFDVVDIFQDVDAGGKVLKEFSYTEFLAATFDRKCLRHLNVRRAAFKCFDKNGDGSISMAELAKGHLLGHLSMEELVEILASLDCNGDGAIDFDEFSAMLRESGKTEST